MARKLDTDAKTRKRYKKLTEKEYKDLYKSIKKYVNFEFKKAEELTRGEKQKIRVYYEAIKEAKVEAKDFVEYAPKSKGKLKAAAKSTGAKIPLKGLKRLVVPSYGDKGVKIDVKERKIKTPSGKSETVFEVTRKGKSGAVEYIYLNPLAMELAPEAEIRYKLANKTFTLGHFAVYDNYMFAAFDSVEAAILLYGKYQNQYKGVTPTHIILNRHVTRPSQSTAAEVREYRERLAKERKAEKRKNKKDVKITQAEYQEYEDLKRKKQKGKKPRKPKK